ncbi:MAG: alpha/beta hydrolase [Polaromonas sp.]|nr:alpha/beta hydrolase [Polaromonas sp.]
MSENFLHTLATAGIPDWFLRAIEHPTVSRYAIAADGCRLHCAFWNEAERDKPPLLLVHGYRAHTHAWDSIAPYLTQHFRVVAVDLMGMGLSDRRSDYGDTTQFAGDLASVVEGLSLGPVTLVGHSFGGACSIHFASRHPHLVRRLVLIDTMMLFAEIDQPRQTTQLGRSTPYPDYDTIISRYRLLPPQPCPPWALAFMAHHSVQQVAGGWHWKFDTNLPAPRIEFDTQAALRTLAMRIDYIGGERSAICSPDRVRLVEQTIGQGRRAVLIPEAFHHILLDQPLALVSTLRALLA